MPDILLHPTTEHILQNAIANSPQVIALCGPMGIGKKTIALWYKSQLQIDDTYTSIIAPVKEVITIDAIRELQKFLKLKTTGKSDLRRCVIVFNAELLTIEAQNILLKTLEEPPLDTVIIFTLSNSKLIRDTLASRLQKINVLPPNKDQLLHFFERQNFSNNKIMKAYSVSGGLPGLMTKILRQEKSDFLQVIDQVKVILNSSLYERLLTINNLSLDKSQTVIFIESLQRMAAVGLELAASQDNSSLAHRWKNILVHSHQAQKDIKGNVSVKLVLTNLLLNV